MAAKLEKTKTPGIYKRGGSYVVVTRHRGRQRKSFHGTLAEAREAKSDRTGSRRQAPAARTPFDEYAIEWVGSFQGRTRRGFDEDTRKSYRRALELYAIPHFGSTPLRDVDRRQVDKLIAKLQRGGLTAGTISKYLAPVRALFSDAVERGDVPANPATKLRINAKAKRTTAEPQSEKTLTRSDLATLLHTIPEQHRLVFEVMAGTGCRVSEALGLECRDLEACGDHTLLSIERQWYRGRLKPNAKTEAGTRTVELAPALAAKLWAVAGDAAGPIFHTRTGGRLSDRNLARVLTNAAKSVGLVGVSNHTLRHTHGSLLLDQGWSIPEVSERLGHADPAITAAVYAHKPRDRRRDLSFLDEPDHGISNEVVEPVVAD